MIYLLNNVIQPYAWGSSTLLSTFFDVDNPENTPQAEMWMGSHPNGCSTVLINGERVLLSELIEAEPRKILGERVYKKFGELPYLLKILAVEQPLSVQVHPDKEMAEKGYALENKIGRPLTVSHRSYKDKNHKPELIYAITKFRAMNGFRPLNEIIELFLEAKIYVLKEEINLLVLQPDSYQFSQFLSSLFNLSDEKKNIAIEELLCNIDEKGQSNVYKSSFSVIQDCAKLYPDDIGIFAPLLLNIVELQPHQAMFLNARTPHAYLQGCGIEIMANSDNVLRAGMTNKHIDAGELLNNLDYFFGSVSLSERKKNSDHWETFDIPVDDFRLDYVKLDTVCSVIPVQCDSLEILLCVEGEIIVSSLQCKQIISRGQSVMISAETASYEISGQGEIMRAYC